MRDAVRYFFSGRTKRSVANGSSSADGGRSGSRPSRRMWNVPKSAPVSHGSLAARVKASGQVRFTAWYIVSTSGESDAIDHGHVAGELVITCSPVARSNQALLSTPWWPGWQPVRIAGVVGEGDRRHRRHGAVLEGRAHRDEAGDVRRLAGGDRVVEHVGVAPVEQEADDVVGTGHRARRSGRRAPRRPGGAAARRGGRRPLRPTPSGCGAPPMSARTVGATSTSRQARGSRPRACTPAPATMNGARACTTPIDPCSPRSPPWSSQLWAEVCMQITSGAAGWSKTWATIS